MDHGALAHMSWNKILFTNYTVLSRKLSMKLGDGRCVSAIAAGEIQMKLFLAKSNKALIAFKRTLHVPDLSCNLMLVRQITEKKFTMAFNDEKSHILTPKGRTIGEGIGHGNLYALVGEVIVPHIDPPVEQQAASVAIGSDRDLWHNRLGHIGERMSSKMTDPKVATGVEFNENEKLSFCDACASGKTHRSIGEIRTTRCLQLVHSGTTKLFIVQRSLSGPIATLAVITLPFLAGTYYYYWYLFIICYYLRRLSLDFQL